jgi:tRNA G18 (ribose-2'-O)-methylase SpoU
MRGYFGIGVEGLSKPMNAGNLFRTAHAFGASFLFTITPDRGLGRVRSDTSRAPEHLPLYVFDRVDALNLPKGCDLVGIELVDEAVELPSFRHPQRAAYVLGPERGVLSEALLARCAHVVRIPTRFCVNLAVAGAIVMYDRALTLGRFAERPVSPLGKATPLADHVHGAPIVRGGEVERPARARKRGAKSG